MNHAKKRVTSVPSVPVCTPAYSGGHFPCVPRSPVFLNTGNVGYTGKPAQNGCREAFQSLFVQGNTWGSVGHAPGRTSGDTRRALSPLGAPRRVKIQCETSSHHVGQVSPGVGQRGASSEARQTRGSGAGACARRRRRQPCAVDSWAVCEGSPVWACKAVRRGA